MLVLSQQPPSLRRWVFRGALAGLVVGVAAFAVGGLLSWRAGDLEPLEGVFWMMIIATAPLSLTVSSLVEALSAIVGPWAEDIFAFLILPAAQGAFLTLLLWSLDRLIRRRRASRATD